jgi:hypothetical protein
MMLSAGSMVGLGICATKGNSILEDQHIVVAPGKLSLYNTGRSEVSIDWYDAPLIVHLLCLCKNYQCLDVVYATEGPSDFGIVIFTAWMNAA